MSYLGTTPKWSGLGREVTD